MFFIAMIITRRRLHQRPGRPSGFGGAYGGTAWMAIGMAMLLTSTTGFSQLLVGESFSYTVGGTLFGQSGGIGWTGTWYETGSTADYDVIVSGSLSHGALSVSGNSLRSRAPNSYSTDLSRAILSPIQGTTGTVAWVSFLLRKDNEGTQPGSNYFGMALYPSSPDAAALFIGDSGETDFYSLGIAGSSLGQVASSRQSIVSTASIFLVVKITFQDGPERIDLFIDPDPTAPEPTTASATKLDLQVPDISAIGLLGGLDALWTVDQIRIGRSFRDVAPPMTAAITVTSSPTTGGIVQGAGTYPVGSTHQLTVQPNAGWKFLSWGDGSTPNPRTIVVPAGGANYTAKFSQQTATITAVSSPVAGGTVQGAGTYTVGSTHQLTVQPNAGWNFLSWGDGSTPNPRTIVVPASGATYTAKFVQQTAKISVVSSPTTGGTVQGAGTYPVGSTQQLTVQPNAGWQFLSWGDGSTPNPRTFVLPVAGATFTAKFTAKSP